MKISEDQQLLVFDQHDRLGIENSEKVIIKVRKTCFNIRVIFPQGNYIKESISSYRGHPTDYDSDFQRAIFLKCHHLIDEATGWCMECETYRDITVMDKDKRHFFTDDAVKKWRPELKEEIKNAHPKATDEEIEEAYQNSLVEVSDQMYNNFVDAFNNKLKKLEEAPPDTSKYTLRIN